MSDNYLREHASQFNMAISALIEMESMKAKNQDRISNNETITYKEEDFKHLLAEYELGYNSSIEKMHRF